ncbi:hypothetical protein ABW21_db0200338 [Orbilia brochopaga]|nr:hypothetical protein ABW21_db0200338 [Drechslerella brochopaga]
MTYGAMGDFLSKFFEKPRRLPPLGKSFTVVAGNPGAMSSRGGLQILQLVDPNAFGRLRVDTEYNNTWRITTTNVLRFELDLNMAKIRTSTEPSDIIIDGDKLSIAPQDGTAGFVLEDNGWTQLNNRLWDINERHGLQLGGLQAILNSRDSIKIIPQQDDPLSLEIQQKAMEISQNLFQYYSADTEVLSSADHDEEDRHGNMILMGKFDPSYLPEELQAKFPVSQAEDEAITFRLPTGEMITYPHQPALGLILLFPLPGTERVGVWIWGSDVVGLRRAARLFPIRTGVSQPDFILLGPESGWKGAAGALALGVFDSKWEIGPSYFRRE